MEKVHCQHNELSQVRNSLTSIQNSPHKLNVIVRMQTKQLHAVIILLSENQTDVDSRVETSYMPSQDQKQACVNRDRRLKHREHQD